MSDIKPLPGINADTKPFWDACGTHQLKIQQCRNCGAFRMPPSFLCPKCCSRNSEWTVASGRGRVYSYVVYHKAFHPAFTGEVPYVAAIVELDEGPHLITNIIGCRPDEVRCNMPVEVVWDDRTEEVAIPLFRPVITL